MNYTEVRDLIREVLESERHYSYREIQECREQIREVERKLDALASHFQVSVYADRNIRVEPFYPEQAVPSQGGFSPNTSF